MSQMRLGWWRDREEVEWMVDRYDETKIYKWKSSISHGEWTDGGSSCYGPSDDLIEFIRPLEDLPPLLNSAVKAAEDRVRTLKAHHEAAQKLADDALFILDEAKRELERLEKECEVKP